MADEKKKEAPKEAKAPKETPKEAAAGTEHTHEHEIPPKADFKKQTPWEHFKQKNGGKSMSKHGFARQNMNRRTGGG